MRPAAPAYPRPHSPPASTFFIHASSLPAAAAVEGRETLPDGFSKGAVGADGETRKGRFLERVTSRRREEDDGRPPRLLLVIYAPPKVDSYSDAEGIFSPMPLLCPRGRSSACVTPAGACTTFAGGRTRPASNR